MTQGLKDWLSLARIGNAPPISIDQATEFLGFMHDADQDADDLGEIADIMERGDVLVDDDDTRESVRWLVTRWGAVNAATDLDLAEEGTTADDDGLLRLKAHFARSVELEDLAIRVAAAMGLDEDTPLAKLALAAETLLLC